MLLLRELKTPLLLAKKCKVLALPLKVCNRLSGTKGIYKPKFAAMSVDLLRGVPVAITDGNLGEALAASAAVPFLKRPIFTERGLMVDGGILRNIPVSPAKAMGAEFIIKSPSYNAVVSTFRNRKTQI